MPITVGQLLSSSMARLREAGVENAVQEGPWILGHVLRCDLAHLYGEPAREVAPAHVLRVEDCVRRRTCGEPLQYVLGCTGFYGLDLEVGPGVLIPRPETERLVEIALDLHAAGSPVCDLCTGSGAVALAVAANAVGTPPIVGVDCSPAALVYARRNLARLGYRNVAFLEGDLFAPVEAGRRFGVVTANPPYVSDRDYAGLPSEVRDHEPAEALRAGPEGMDILVRVLAVAPTRLAPHGWLVCELGHGQGRAVLQMAAQAGFASAEVVTDYAGRERVLRAQWAA